MVPSESKDSIQRLVFLGEFFFSVFSFFSPNMIPPMQATMSGV